MQAEIGVIHGRFQPLHIGHMEYLLAGKSRCQLLVVGISNPDPWQTKAEVTDPGRSESIANPCTYYERYLMLEKALIEAGVAKDHFRIIPFPHSFPDRLPYYLPPRAEYYLSIYDAWGEAKLKRFTGLGLKTEVLWRRAHKITTGTAIRQLIAQDGPWQQLVPKAVAHVITDCQVDQRIKTLLQTRAATPFAKESIPTA